MRLDKSQCRWQIALPECVVVAAGQDAARRLMASEPG